ncbi:hypothetical protein AOLI_G00320360 [Acnodon oligacanthus]
METGLNLPYLRKVQQAPGRAAAQDCAVQSWHENKGEEKIRASENQNWCNGPGLGVSFGTTSAPTLQAGIGPNRSLRVPVSSTLSSGTLHRFYNASVFSFLVALQTIIHCAVLARILSVRLLIE